MFEELEEWRWWIVGFVTVVVMIWVIGMIVVDRAARKERRQAGRRRSTDWSDFEERDLGALVEMMPASERPNCANELRRLLDRHEALRFSGVIEVRRADVGPPSFALLYAASRQRRPIAQTDVVRLSPQHVRRLLKACQAGTAQRA